MTKKNHAHMENESHIAKSAKGLKFVFTIEEGKSVQTVPVQILM